jgi:hypothetical protein
MDSIKNFIKNKLEFKEMNSIVGGNLSGCVYYEDTNQGCGDSESNSYDDNGNLVFHTMFYVPCEEAVLQSTALSNKQVLNSANVTFANYQMSNFKNSTL